MRRSPRTKQQHEAEAAQNRLLQEEADRLAAQIAQRQKSLEALRASGGRGQATPARPRYSAAGGRRRDPAPECGGRSSRGRNGAG